MIVHVVGAGLAGSEAAHFLAEAGIPVILHEMRPLKMTEAHKTGNAAELVCSNSLKSKAPGSAPWLLKEEMRKQGSLILQAAEVSQSPGGDALSVDRVRFSEWIERKLRSHPKILFSTDEVEAPFVDGITLIATGPLTSPALCEWIAKAVGQKELYFYDAIAPIVETTSLDPEHYFAANRYGKGGETAYLNCPLDKDQYETFVDALLQGEKFHPGILRKKFISRAVSPLKSSRPVAERVFVLDP